MLLKKLKTLLQKLIKNYIYTYKPPLMMGNEWPESGHDNFGKCIYQFQPKPRHLETWKVLNKIRLTKSVFII